VGRLGLATAQHATAREDGRKEYNDLAHKNDFKFDLLPIYAEQLEITNFLTPKAQLPIPNTII
jgi:hypothetical protein